MPRLKPSLGTIEIKATFEEFPKWITKELQNFRDWNPALVKQAENRWSHALWTIVVHRTHIKVTSQEPLVRLGGHLKINMGHGRLEF